MFNFVTHKYPQDLTALIALALIGVIFIVVPPFNQTPLRIIFAAVLLLFIPGYAFIAAMFPKKDDISGIERFTLSIGFSIVITVFDGLVISYTRWLFRPNSISMSLFLIILTFAIIAYYLRMRLPDDEQFSLSYTEFLCSVQSDDDDKLIDDDKTLKSEETNQFKVKGRKKIIHQKSDTNSDILPECVPPEIEKALIIGLVLSIIMVSSMLVYAKLTQEKDTFTALYILGDEGMAEKYPTSASLGEPIVVTVGIENYEGTNVNYILQMRLDGNVLNEMTIPVKDNDKWIGNVSYTPSQLIFGKSKLEFAIFKEEIIGNPYRSVHLWISHGYSIDFLNANMEHLESSQLPIVINGDMESNNGWEFYSTNGNVTGEYMDNSGSYSSRAFIFNNSFKGIIPDWADQQHEIHQNIKCDKDGVAVLSVFVTDTCTQSVESGDQFKQILLNNILIWQDGVNGDEGWENIQIPVKLESGNNTLTLRLMQKGRSEIYPVEVIWDDVLLQDFSKLSKSSMTTSVDFSLPTSKVLDLPEYTSTTEFTVKWNGTDIDSGISYYTIDYSTDNISWYTWISKTTETSSVFSGEDAQTYYFRSKAVDKAGNKEMVHTTFDAKTTVYASLPTLTLDISPNPSSGLTSLTVESSEPLRELNCYVTPREYSAATASVEMTSSDDMIWTGKYTVMISGTHDVEVFGKDLANNTVTIFDTILSDTSLEYFTIEISPDPISTGSVEIIVTPSVALKTTPSLDIRCSGNHIIEISSSTISGDEYTYIGTINTTLHQGIAYANATAYTKDSKRIKGSESFIIDYSNPTISSLNPANGAVVNDSSPTISANFQDAYTSINPNNVILKVNDIDVTTDATVSSTSITYIPAGLADGDVDVYLSVRDAAGNTAVESWMFNMNTTL